MTDVKYYMVLPANYIIVMIDIFNFKQFTHNLTQLSNGPSQKSSLNVDNSYLVFSTEPCPSPHRTQYIYLIQKMFHLNYSNLFTIDSSAPSIAQTSHKVTTNPNA